MFLRIIFLLFCEKSLEVHQPHSCYQYTLFSCLKFPISLWSAIVENVDSITQHLNFAMDNDILHQRKLSNISLVTARFLTEWQGHVLGFTDLLHGCWLRKAFSLQTGAWLRKKFAVSYWGSIGIIAYCSVLFTTVWIFLSLNLCWIVSHAGQCWC